MRRQSFRLALALTILASLSLLLLQHCRLAQHLNRDRDDEFFAPGPPVPLVDIPPPNNPNHFHSGEVRKLLLQIAHFKEEVAQLKDDLRNSVSCKAAPLAPPSFIAKATPPLVTAGEPSQKYSPGISKVVDDSTNTCSDLIRQKIAESEIKAGFSLNNEYEVVPFSLFTWSRIYLSELGLGKRVVEKPIGFKRKDLLEALSGAIRHLNTQTTQPFTVDDFIEGEYRTVPTSGSQFELLFREKNHVEGGGSSTSNHSTTPQQQQHRKVTLIRPFAPLAVVSSEKINLKQLINIVLPLAGRLDTFKGFMDKLVRLILHQDRRIFLTVVYFGHEGLEKVRNIITKASRLSNFKHIKLLTLNETFSRGKALQVKIYLLNIVESLLFPFLRSCHLSLVTCQ